LPVMIIFNPAAVEVRWRRRWRRSCR